MPCVPYLHGLQGANDPYCGWCSLENKCSLRGACAEAAQDPLYWLSYKSGRCTTITEVHPPQIQRTTARILNLVIDNLPALEGQFFCAFSALGKVLVMNATRSANGVNCATPHTQTLCHLYHQERVNHFTAKLSVRMKVGPDFVATNFTFYDCSTYTSCTQCVSSDFPCDWCVTGHRCTHDTGENCRNDVLVTGVAVKCWPKYSFRTWFCPRINKTANGSTEILVASGISKRISVKVDNIQQHIARMRFLCQFNIEGRVKQVNAQLIGEVMYCEEMVVTLKHLISQQLFAVIWDVNKPFDNPENIHVLIFRCSGMAQSCGICLELPRSTNVAGVKILTIGAKYMNIVIVCQPFGWIGSKHAQILRYFRYFSPKSGPWEGGTNITIKGINLGRVFGDIANNVRVIHEDRKVIAECVPHEELYVKTTQIVCHVEKPPNLTTGLMGGPMVGYIEVKVLNDYTARSREQYSFVNPRITSIKPGKGPRSGGTILEIWGLHMDAGSSAEAYVGALACNVTVRDSNQAVCTTPASKETIPQTVRMKFDNGLRVFEDYKYLYVEDPAITYVESGSTGQRGHSQRNTKWWNFN
ncbi:hypothetical protein CEXT_325961 [Caerostris extrusa]|uniref:Uncharacterized protein n=1 Tax=Caerostris extrusa TaxID=172846 RepID=A0AAV4SAD1_CAEEX|nr:hypothetical protein CEXT_325961 [Caerostris extrusa]